MNNCYYISTLELKMGIETSGGEDCNCLTFVNSSGGSYYGSRFGCAKKDLIIHVN
jgi:hypothetical protein